MASFFRNAFLLCVSLVICLQFSAANANADLIEIICSRTFDPHFCLQQLRSNSHSNSANYTSLAGILLNKVESRTNSLKNIIDVYIRRGDLPVNQQLRLAACVDDCNEALVDISWCRYALKLGSGDFKGLKSQTFSLLNHYKKCDNLFKEAPVEPLKIEEASRKIQELVDAILVISRLGMLKHPFDVCSGFNCGRV